MRYLSLLIDQTSCARLAISIATAATAGASSVIMRDSILVVEVQCSSYVLSRTAVSLRAAGLPIGSL